MSSKLTDLLTAIILSLTVATTPSAEAQPDAAATAPLLVSVKVKKLRLVKWVFGPGHKGDVGLDGVVEVQVHNRTESPATVENLDTHGLVFTNVDSADAHLVLHPCQCARDMEQPIPTVTIAPGESHSFVLDSWGCKSMWVPPPAGKYDLVYRVRLSGPFEAQPTREHRREIVGRCKAMLSSPQFWNPKTTFTSKAIKVTLRTPKRKRAPR